MRSLRREVVGQIKEKMCYVSLHYANDRVLAVRSPHDFERSCTDSDGAEHRLKDECFRAAEVQRVPFIGM